MPWLGRNRSASSDNRVKDKAKTASRLREVFIRIPFVMYRQRSAVVLSGVLTEWKNLYKSRAFFARLRHRFCFDFYIVLCYHGCSNKSACGEKFLHGNEAI